MIKMIFNDLIMIRIRKHAPGRCSPKISILGVFWSTFVQRLYFTITLLEYGHFSIFDNFWNLFWTKKSLWTIVDLDTPRYSNFLFGHWGRITLYLIFTCDTCRIWINVRFVISWRIINSFWFGKSFNQNSINQISFGFL